MKDGNGNPDQSWISSISSYLRHFGGQFASMMGINENRIPYNRMTGLKHCLPVMGAVKR